MRTRNAWRAYLTQPAAIDPVTETSRRVNGPAVLFGRRGWAHFALWLAAWNAAVPIRLVGLIRDPRLPPSYIGQMVARLIVAHTLWALATYAMFRLALRARREPLRPVLAVLGLLSVPLMLLRYYGAIAF